MESSLSKVAGQGLKVGEIVVFALLGVSFAERGKTLPCRPVGAIMTVG